MSTYRKGQRIRVAIGSIQRTTGAAWAGDRGEIVEVTGDGYKARFDSGFVADNWYRVRVGEAVYEPMSIATVGQLLAEVGVDRVACQAFWPPATRARHRPYAT